MFNLGFEKDDINEEIDKVVAAILATSQWSPETTIAKYKKAFEMLNKERVQQKKEEQEKIAVLKEYLRQKEEL